MKDAGLLGIVFVVGVSANGGLLVVNWTNIRWKNVSKTLKFSLLFYIKYDHKQGNV